MYLCDLSSGMFGQSYLYTTYKVTITTLRVHNYRKSTIQRMLFELLVVSGLDITQEFELNRDSSFICIVDINCVHVFNNIVLGSLWAYQFRCAGNTQSIHQCARRCTR